MGMRTYQEILDGGFSGGHTVCPGCVDLGDDVLVIMSRHPDSEYGWDGSVAIINSRLLSDESFQQRFREKIRMLNHLITDDLEASGLDTASLALCYFCTAIDKGHIDPNQTPLSQAVKLSGLEGWQADMISCHVYARYIDRVKVGKRVAEECGSLQQVGTMQ